MSGREMIRLKGNLDFTLVKDGKVGFFDTKTVEDDHFTYSRITAREHQLNLACSLNERGIKAGFIFYFRKPDKITFFSGQYIQRMGKGTRFLSSMGVPLGSLISMDLSALLL